MKAVLTALAVFIAPLPAAHALTIVPGETYGDAFIINPGETISFDFEVTEPTFVSPIAISGTGSTIEDLESVVFGVNTFDASFSETIFLGDIAAGFAVLEGFLATENFSLVMKDGVLNPVQLTFNFVTSVPAPVPLPAAGLLLAGGLSLLGAGSAIRRHRSRSAELPLA